jgi:thioester reductase-like protein
LSALISGSTGFLGRALLAQLELPAVALLRGSDFERRATVLSRQTGAAVTALAGDVTRPCWGLDESAIAGLREQVDVVVNVASETGWAAPWARLHSVNIDGARHAVDVAGALGVPLLHVSSLFVAFDHDEFVPEAMVDEGSHLSKYERSKSRGEWVVALHAERAQVPTSIVRVGALLGDLAARSRQERPRTRVRMTRLLVDAPTMIPWLPAPVLPYSATARIDLCPRDLVAAALAHMITDLAGHAASHDMVVRNLGLGGNAPLVGQLLDESRSILARQGFAFRHVPVPGSWLRNVSAFFDRWSGAPGAAMFIGFRYLSSRTRYLGTCPGAETLTIRQLLRTMGIVEPDPVVPDPFYASWLG